MQRLMIADDSAVIRKVAKRILAGLDFMVAEAESSVEALAMCQSELPNLLVVDAAMDGALELIADVRRMDPDRRVRIYYCVVEADLKHLMLGKRAGADDFLMKPFDRAILTSAFGKLAAAA
jgi:two-component system chemotaxis response regulator CheY